jgi:hypothetical protein
MVELRVKIERKLQIFLMFLLPRLIALQLHYSTGMLLLLWKGIVRTA